MTQQVVVPKPSAALFKKPVIAKVTPTEDAKTYDVSHPQVVKAKHLELGVEYRPFVHGQPRGTVRVPEAVTRNEDGSEVYVEFSTSHAAQPYKAAYRFWQVVPDEAAPVVDRCENVNVKTLMEAKPGPVRERPTPPEHLTHKPFAALGALLDGGL